MSDYPGRHERAPLGSLDLLASSAWSPWPLPEVVETTPSTMLEIERRAVESAPEGTVVVAEEQTAGRGRRGRTWDSAARAGLWWSLLLRPAVPPDRLGWLPLVVGVGVARGLSETTGAHVALKWPNDLLLEGGKVAGILAERLGDGSVVVGVGINVDQETSELPEGGISLRQAGYAADRTQVLIQVLASVARSYREWISGADPHEAYAALSATLGREVRADLGERVLVGLAARLGPAGELVIVDAGGVEHVVSAGDVTLLR